jgi:hypothetical protein
MPADAYGLQRARRDPRAYAPADDRCAVRPQRGLNFLAGMKTIVGDGDNDSSLVAAGGTALAVQSVADAASTR